jgi:hypothetical protein
MNENDVKDEEKDDALTAAEQDELEDDGNQTGETELPEVEQLAPGAPSIEELMGTDAPAHADTPVPTHASTEAQARAAALDAEYATARAEVAEHGYKRTVHCRSCGTVVSLGEACPVDAQIAV